MEATQERILIVDDDALNVRVLVEFLRSEYSLTVARDGPQTLERLRSGPLPDLILLDLMMPGMDGYEVCRRIKADPATRDVPVMVVTALNQAFDESAAFDAGAVDFLTKPIAPAVLQARVRTQLRLRRGGQLLSSQNARLDEQLRSLGRELAVTRAVMVRALSLLGSLRDDASAAHQRRTQGYVQALCRAAQRHPAFAGQLPERVVDAVQRLAPLHDIGKVGLSDRVLQRPGPLTDDDWREMRRHPVIGREVLLAALEGEGGMDIEFLRLGADLVGTHHENWDGSGYPDGLSGEAIPLAGRLMAIADGYDTAVTDLPGKPAVSHEEALRSVEAAAGSRYDPRLVEVLRAVADEFRAVAEYDPDLPA